jgi:hypothetical protein
MSHVFPFLLYFLIMYKIFQLTDIQKPHCMTNVYGVYDEHAKSASNVLVVT